jgi:3-oxoacyl-[acyl-carrier-protein] synthase-3
MRARIVGTGRALPERVVTNDELARTLDTSDEWIVARSGIRARRILDEGRATSDLSAEAGRAALAAAGLRADELDAIVVGTMTPDTPMPSCAVLVQHKLGARCPAFDVNAACAGFVFALATGDALVRARTFRRVLVVGADAMSRVVDWRDRSTSVLFGDGAGAVVLVADEEAGARGVLSTHLYSDGAQAAALVIPSRDGFLQMNGRVVFAHAVRNLARASQVALEANGFGAADVDQVIAHQANLRILEAVAEKTGIPMAKFFLDIDRYGNTSSASIPIALDEARAAGAVREGQLVLMCALGAGFAWGSALVRL